MGIRKRRMEIYLAGERVSPGLYKRIDTLKEVVLTQKDYLPASCDVYVACYERIEHT
jgi:hypothetical protein